MTNELTKAQDKLATFAQDNGWRTTELRNAPGVLTGLQFDRSRIRITVTYGPQRFTQARWFNGRHWRHTKLVDTVRDWLITHGDYLS